MPFRLRAGRLIPIATLAAVYFVTGTLGLSLRIAHGNATPVWAPTGISLAVLLIFGRELWPGIALGALVVNLVSGAPPLFCALAAAGNTVAVLIALALVRRRGGIGALERFDQVVLLVAASFLGPLASASVGTAGLWLTHAIPVGDVRHTWSVWWLGDSLGFILVTPLLLAWLRPPDLARPDRAVEALVLSAGLIGVAVAAFGPWSYLHLPGDPFAFAVMPFVVWAALRFGQRGATLATLAASGAALYGAVMTDGPLSHAAQGEILLLWQAFSVVLGITALGIAGSASERDRAEAQALRAEQELRRHSATLEDRVAERTAALAQHNDQLIEFSYTVSHDLRTPIRAIHSYVDVLADELRDRIDPTSAEYLRRIREATVRMDTLIRNLLDYSRLANIDLAREPVPLARVISDALAHLEPEFARREVVVRLGVDVGLPEVLAHAPTLEQAIRNLLQNAAKFVPEERRPEIAIDAERRGDRIRLWVGDNGIGVPAEHRERIFRVFERLHPPDRFPGTGIGLAVVKRALERMDGAVGLDPDTSAGSRFWIELRIAGANGDLHGASAPRRERPGD